MAKKDDNVDLGNLELDDFDMDPFAGMGEGFGEMKDDRSPITHFTESLKQTASERMLDKGFLRRLVSMALPKGYNQALNAYDGLTDALDQVYKDNKDELSPHLRKLNQKLSKSNPAIMRMLPDGLKKALAAADEEESRSKEGPTQLELNIKGLDDLFKLEAQDKAQTRAKDAIDDLVDERRFNSEMAARVQIGKGIGRLVAYQDKILINYQRKDLEIKYRHLDVSSKLLVASQEFYANSLNVLKEIGKNTGLPDYVKMHSDEVVKQRMKQRFADTIANSAGAWAGRYFTGLKKNGSDYLKGFLEAFAQLNQGEGLGVNKAQMAGGMAGSFAGDVIASGVKDGFEYLSSMAAPHLAKLPFIKRGDLALREKLTGIPEKLNAFAQSRDDGPEGSGLMWMLREKLKGLLDQYTPSTHIQGSGYDNLDAPAKFDNLFYTSVTEIIPGYLASIDKWTRTLATGEDQEEAAYSHYSGGFVSRSTLNDQHVRIGLKEGKGDLIRRSVDSLLRDMKANDLSLDAKRALRRRLLKDMAAGTGFQASKYVKIDTWQDQPQEIAEELVEFFADTFGLDIEGNQHDKSLKMREFTQNFTENFLDTARRIPNYMGRMAVMNQFAGRRTWRDLGLTEYDTNEGDRVRVDALYDMLLGTSDEDMAGPEKVKKKKINPFDLNAVAQEMKAKRDEQRAREEKARNGQSTEEMDVIGKATGGVRPGSLTPPPARLHDVAYNLNLPDIFNTSDDKTHQRLDRLAEMMAAGHELVAAILEAMPIAGIGAQGGEGPAGAGPAAAGSGQSWYKRFRSWFGDKLSNGLDRAGSWGWKGTKGYAKLSGKMYGKLFGGVGLGLSGLGWLMKAPFKSINGLGVTDIYVLGESEPAMLARKIRSKFYYDINTKKPISSLEDITGPVMDQHGEMVITQEDFDKGLVNGEGESLAAYLGRKAMKLGGKIIGGTFNYTTAAYSAMGKVANFAKDVIKEQFTQFDAYFPGEVSPRIRSYLLKKGFYRKEDGSPIFSLKDITGAVFDMNGNEIISQEEIDRFKSFFTRNGSLLYTIGRGFASVGKFARDAAIKGALKYGQAVGKMYKGMWNVGKSILTSPFKLFKNKGFHVGWGTRGGGGSSSGGGDSDDIQYALFEVNVNQLKVQQAILSAVQKQFSEDDPIKWDSDHDGVRDNSWADILKRRKAKTAGMTGGGGNSGADDIVEAIDALGDRLDDNFDDLEEVVEESNEDSWLDQAADAKSLFGDKEGKGKGRRRGRMPKGKAGLFRRALGGLGRLAGGALSLLGRGALAALPLAGSLIGGAASLAATALSSPIVLGGLAVGGLAYGGYKWYKASKVKNFPLFKLRMIQYGVSPTDEGRVQKILALEALAKPGLKLNGRDSSLDPNKFDTNQIYEIFSIERGSDREAAMLKWVATRFRPVFLIHSAAADQFAGTSDLSEIDTKVKAVDLRRYVDYVDLSGMGAAYNDDEATPFSGDLDEDASDVNDAIEEAKKAADKNASKADPSMKLDPGTAKFVDNQKANTKLGVSAKGTADPKKLAAKMALYAKGDISGGNAITQSGGPRSDSASMKSLDIPTAVRYKAYGLKEFTLDKAEQLAKTEEIFWDRVTYSGTNNAGISGDMSILQDSVMSVFKPSTTEGIDNTKLWLTKRFLPAFLQYCISTRRRYNGAAKDANRNLTGPLMKEVLEEVTTATASSNDGVVSIWSVLNSPWEGYQLETLPGSVKLYIDALPTNVGGPLKVEGMKEQQQIGVDKTQYKERLENAAKGNPYNSVGRMTSGGNIFQNMKDIFSGGGAGKGAEFGTGAMVMSGNMAGNMGVEVKHPGGGSGGDINAIPVPTGSGWDGVKNTIIGAAKMLGFDPAVAATVAGIESTWRPGAGAGGTSAKGLFQFIDGTWNMMLNKYGRKFGIAPNASPYDARANAILGVQYLVDNYNTMKKILPKVTDSALYMAHFLGPGGASRFFSAPRNAPASLAVDPSAIRSNPGIFLKKGGGVRTVAEVLQLIEGRLGQIRSVHGLKGNETVDVNTTAQTQNTSDVAAAGLATAGPTDPNAEAAAMEKANAPTVPPLLAPMSSSSAPTASMASVASRAASAATGPSGGDAAIASGLMETSATTGGSQTAVSPPPTPSVSTAAAAAAQSTNAAEAQQISVSVGPLLQRQLDVLNSVDSKLGISNELLQEIKNRLAGGAPQPGMVEANKEVSAQATPGPEPIPRMPISTRRPNAVT